MRGIERALKKFERATKEPEKGVQILECFTTSTNVFGQSVLTAGVPLSTIFCNVAQRDFQVSLTSLLFKKAFKLYIEQFVMQQLPGSSLRCNDTGCMGMPLRCAYGCEPKPQGSCSLGQCAGLGMHSV